MAAGGLPTYFNLGDPEVRENWEQELHIEVLKRCALFNPDMGLIAESDQALCERKKEVFKEGGTRATVTLLRQLKGRPTYGTATLRDREEGLGTTTYKYEIQQVRHATRIDGRITKQRVTWDVYKKSQVVLGEYWAKILEAAGMMHLCGINTNISNQAEEYLDGTYLGYTMCNTPRTPDSNHIFRTNALATDDAVGLDPSATLDVKDIDLCVAMAKTLPLPIRPVMWHGKYPLYVMFIHPNQTYHLRQNSVWYAEMRDTLKGGAYEDSPLWTGALGVHNGVLLVESPYLPCGVSTVTNPGGRVPNTRRAVFCGAQALVLGLGKTHESENQFQWSDDNWDYGDKTGIAASLIAGIASPNYNIAEQGTQDDFAKIVVTSYARDIIVSQ